MKPTPLHPRTPESRQPPANTEAEQALLGSILFDNAVHARVAPFLLPEHFANGVHGRIFAAIGELIRAGTVADPITLKQRFEADGSLTPVGGTRYLVVLVEAAGAPINAEHYARAIVDAARRRAVLEAAHDLVEAAHDGAGIEDTLAEIVRRIIRPNGHSPLDARIVTGRAFVASYTPPDWVIDGILQRSRLYACTSLTGHGKTAVWLYNACMIQAGRPVAGIETEPGNVVILAGENPEDLRARMLGMARAFDLSPKQLPFVLPGTFPLTEEGAEQLRRDIDRLEVPLVAIIGDTASSFFPGDDENNNVQAGHYARTARTLTACPGNPAVVLLAHPVKNASRENLLPRGGGAFLNEVDGNLTLWSPQLGEATALHWQGKIRGPDFDPLSYTLKQVPTGRRDRKGREVFTVIARPIDDFEAANQADQNRANEDAVLRALCGHPDWSLAEIAKNLGWVGDKGAERWRVQRALKTLEADKLARILRGKWRVTTAGRKEVEEGDAADPEEA